jgi:type I restriction enzyme S subunit
MTNRAHWPRVNFGDVVRQVKDKVDPQTSGLDRYIAGEHMDTDDLRIRRWGQIGSDYLGPAFHMRFRPGQVLYGSRRTYLRKVAVADFEGICANTTFILAPKDPDVLLAELLPFIMQTEAFHDHSIKQSKGSVNPYVNFSDLAWYEFALPPLEEQRRIAQMLWSLEELNDALSEAQMRAYVVWRAISAHEFPQYGESNDELLDAHYEIVSGQVDPTANAYRDLPLIAPNHIESGTGRILALESANDQNAISGKYAFDAGVVLYSKIRPNLVKATIAPRQGLCSADMYPLTTRRSIRAQYLLEILLSDRFTQFAVSGSMRTGMPKLNREHLARYKCKVPTIEEQDDYLARVAKTRAVEQDIISRMSFARNLKRQILAEVLT